MKNQAQYFHCDIGLVSASNHSQTPKNKEQKKKSLCSLLLIVETAQYFHQERTCPGNIPNINLGSALLDKCKESVHYANIFCHK